MWTVLDHQSLYDMFRRLQCLQKVGHQLHGQFDIKSKYNIVFFIYNFCNFIMAVKQVIVIVLIAKLNVLHTGIKKSGERFNPKMYK